MKTNILLIILASVALLSSCGTMSQSARNTSTGFVNSIYYTPSQAEMDAYNNSKAELAELQKNTKKGITQTIFVGDTNVVNIDYNPNYTYSIVDDDESYEARLRKFDSPVYTVNIEWNDPYYTGWDSWYRPYWATIGTAWYNPWWGPYYSWWGPSWGWHNWYSWYGWDNLWFGYGWYDPWWGPHYGGLWGPAWDPTPFPPHHQPHNDIYYGKRETGSSYNGHGAVNHSGGSYTRRDPSLNKIRGNQTNISSNATNQSSSQSSIYRRGGNNHNGAVYNNSAINSGNSQATQNVKPSNSQSSSQSTMYRRSATQNNRQTTTKATVNQNREQQYQENTRRTYESNSNYYRNGNNSNYNRSGGSTHNSGNPGRNSGGSSYRR